MMEKILLLVTALMLSTSISSVFAKTWNLDSCITYAQTHNLKVRSRVVQYQSAEYDVTEAKDAFLPQVNGYAAQSFSFGRGLTSENTYAHNNTQNFNIGANLSLPLFQGLSALRRVDYTKAALNTVLEQLEAERDNVELNVTTQYLQVLYARQVADLALEQLRLARYELARRNDLIEAGRLPEIDFYEAQSQVAQEELNVVTTENDYSMSLLELAQMLDLPDATDFEIAPLPENSDRLLPDTESIYSISLINNHSLRAANNQITTAERQITLARTGYLPRLSMSAGIGTNYYRLSRYENPTFSGQMRHNFSQNIQFSLSLPIFDAFSTRNSIRKAKLQLTTAHIQAEEARNSVYKAITQASRQVEASRRKLVSATTARTAAQESFDGIREKYNYGKANSADYEQARSTLVRSQLQEIQAEFELRLRSRILAFYARENNH